MKNISKNTVRPNLSPSDVRRLEFHISYQCNNNCIFCGERFRLDKNKNTFVPFKKIKSILLVKSKNGIRHLTLTGGEPTFHPDFLEILRFAKELGLKTYVSSNGGLFAYPDFCRRAALFLDEVCFSLHGHNARLHNRHTRNRASFGMLERAFENFNPFLKRTKIYSNTVVTSHNFKYLPQIIGLAKKQGISQMLISNIVPEGNALVNYQELSVSLAQFSKRLPGLVDIAKKKRVEIRFFGLPLCIIGPKLMEHSNDLWWSPRLTVEKHETKNNSLVQRESRYPVRNRIKIGQCDNCVQKKRCGGIFFKYIQDFGREELSSIK